MTAVSPLAATKAKATNIDLIKYLLGATAWQVVGLPVIDRVDAILTEVFSDALRPTRSRPSPAPAGRARDELMEVPIRWHGRLV